MPRRLTVGCSLAACAALSSIVAADEIVERTRKELTLLDVAVDGPGDRITDLTAEDFSVFVEGDPVALDGADPICDANAAAPADDVSPPHFLFYFDQHMLTMGARAGSIDTAERIAPMLVESGGRISIVSSGAAIESFLDFSDDTGEVLQALGRLRDDESHWDPYPTTESSRREDIARASWTSDAAGCNLARLYQREETRRVETALELFSSVLMRFEYVDHPKIALYFGDVLRIDAGHHYLTGSGCEPSGFDALPAFQATTTQAAALGVRIYAIESGAVLATGFRERSANQDGQSGLKALALDTGGDAFLGGMSPKKLARRLEKEADCIYVLSFDAGELKRDTPLSVRVRVDVPGVTAHSRSAIVIGSESARRTSRLMAAFTAPDAVERDVAMVGGIIPLGFVDGRYSALVQVVVPGSELGVSREWDLGASVVVGRTVRDDLAARIGTRDGTVPLVLESEMAFRPGPFEINLVGQDANTGEIGIGRIVGEWPNARERPVVTPTAVLQDRRAGISRDGEARDAGPVAVSNPAGLDPTATVVFQTLVCSPSRGESLHVVRAIELDGTRELPRIDADFTEDRCVVIRDALPVGAAALSRSGAYRLVVHGTDIATRMGFGFADERDISVDTGAPVTPGRVE